MSTLTTKADLYNDIDNFRIALGIENDVLCSPVNFVEGLGYEILYLNFKTPGLRGMATILPGFEPGTIILNGKRSTRENGFVVLHEMTHCIRHVKQHVSSIQCYDNPRKSQNPYYEWEANEAAAELLMPYRIFIPDVVRLCTIYGAENPTVLYDLLQKYQATQRAIIFRVKNLKYEIAHYCSTGQLSSDSLLSRKAQESRGIHMDKYSLSDLISITKYSHV